MDEQITTKYHPFALQITTILYDICLTYMLVSWKVFATLPRITLLAF